MTTKCDDNDDIPTWRTYNMCKHKQWQGRRGWWRWQSREGRSPPVRHRSPSFPKSYHHFLLSCWLRLVADLSDYFFLRSSLWGCHNILCFGNVWNLNPKIETWMVLQPVKRSNKVIRLDSSPRSPVQCVWWVIRQYIGVGWTARPWNINSTTGLTSWPWLIGKYWYRKDKYIIIKFVS